MITCTGNILRTLLTRAPTHNNFNCWQRSTILAGISVVKHQVRWATHKSGGSTQNGRNAQPKFLGFKNMHGAFVKTGQIILRQRGTKWFPSTDVGMGRDFTLFALKPGKVVLWYDIKRQRRYVS